MRFFYQGTIRAALQSSISLESMLQKITFLGTVYNIICVHLSGQ